MSFKIECFGIPVAVVEEHPFNGLSYPYLLSLWVRGRFPPIVADGANVSYFLRGHLGGK